jgi:hypothetical protein
MCYIVQYRCLYRDHWYDDSEHFDFASAAHRALFLRDTYHRVVRVISSSGTVMAA